MALNSRELQYIIRAKDEATRTFKNVGKSVQDTANQVGNLSTRMQALGGIIAGLGLQRFARAGRAAILDFVTTASQLQQAQISFETMLGSADLAAQKLTELSDFAQKTPFTITGARSAAQQLLAVGFSADEIIPTLKEVGDVAAGIGRGEVGFQRLILNLGQVRTQGKLTGREIRDFAVNGVPILEEVAKVLGVTTEQVQQLTSDGQVSSEVVTQAFRNMSSEGGRFFNLMEKQMATAEGKFSNLSDAVTRFKEVAGKPLADALGALAEAIIPVIERLTEWTAKNPEIAKFLALFGALMVAVTSILVPIGLVIAAFVALGVPLATGGIVFAAVSGIIALVSLLILKFQELKDGIGFFAEVVNDNIRRVGESLKRWFVDIIELAKQKLEALQKAFAAIVASVKAFFGASAGDGERRQSGGVVQRSGIVTVGEQGEELVALPQGSRVFEAGLTRRILSDATSNISLNMHSPLVGQITVQNEADEDRLVQKVEEALTRMIQLKNLRAV